MSVLNFYRYFETEIADVRVRRAWTGKLVLQIRHNRKRQMIQAPANAGAIEDAGTTAWKDANGNSPDETAAVVAYLQARKGE